MLEPPFADEGLAARFDLLRRRGVDHVVVIRGDLVMQALGGMGEQVPVLVDRAALDGHAVPDGDDGLVAPRRAIDAATTTLPPAASPKCSSSSRPTLTCSAAMTAE